MILHYAEEGALRRENMNTGRIRKNEETDLEKNCSQ